MDPLRREEAADRSRLLHVRGYDVDLDLTTGDAEFGSTARIEFDCRNPGAETFVDLAAGRIDSAVLNGAPLGESAIGAGRIKLSGLRERNELVVSVSLPYSRTGEGFHRFEDPADGEVYTWTELGVFNTGNVFAAFDQPDLKAPLRLRVRAPDGWTVISNAAGERDPGGTWVFAETPPLATYHMVVVAGPYASVHASHGGIPLGLHVRKSLLEHLDADELFADTRACLDYYEGIFGMPYPFGKYDQAFVPEFLWGAMENPGCVKFTDRLVYRSRVTDDQLALRTMILAHEMAHMWFGDLVTMRWWDDLWLNESFAEYIGHQATVEATRHESAWTNFCANIKAWGYRQDELPSSHPISTEVADTDAALLNLDGISYAKGGGVLKQLVAWVGFEPFLAGLRSYFDRHAFGNATLTDLLSALEAPSGRDLRAWSREWLEAPGVNVLRAELETDVDGTTYQSVRVRQSAPAERPTLRSHRIAIGLYDQSDDRLVRRDRLEVDISGELTEVAALAGVRVPDLLLLNDDDLTWAKIRLDERSLATIRGGGLARLGDSLARALIWAAAWDMTRDAELPVGDYLSLVLDGVGGETEISLVGDILKRARQATDELGVPEQRDERLTRLAARTLELLAGAEGGSDLQLAYARAYAASVARTEDIARVQGWLAGKDVPDGLAIDEELRWLIVRRLAVLGAIDEAGIAAEQERDATSGGAEWAEAARAALPTPEAKARAWEAIVTPDAHSTAVLQRISEDFWHAEQLDTCAAYVEPYLRALPEVWATRASETAQGITETMFPRLLVAPSTIEQVDAVLATELDPALRRLLVEGRSDLMRAIRTRGADG